MSRAESNGVPMPITFETTDEIVQAIEDSPGGLSSFVAMLRGDIEATPAQGGSPEKHAKSVKRHNWITAILVLILGPSGVYASMQVMSDRSKENSLKIQHLEEDHAKQQQETTPSIEKNTDDIRLIQVDMSRIEKSVGDVKTQTSQIADGIEELKQENVSRLKEELNSARRELRRRDRDR